MLPEQYDAKEREAHWRAFWKTNNTYGFTNQAPVFSIDTPPPTLSGSMHLGHAFSYTQGDFIARYKRMRGYQVFYPFGTDDNGLATIILVEKLKKVRGVTMDRKAFRELCLQTVHEELPAFAQAWKDIAMSANFDAAYSTIDDHSQRVSQRSFIDLYDKGYVYRADNPVAWCVQCQTAIAQAEYDNVEMDSSFNEIKFPVGGYTAVIATTRPELLPACVALVHHPDDTRYSKFTGKLATVPLFNYTVPILADSAVDPQKGTGIMMVCTFGDKEDVEKWKRHKLPLRVAITKDGKLSDIAGKFAGLKIKEARKAILDTLQEHGFVLSRKPIKHAVNVHERCGTEVEFLKSAQWFIKVLEHKEKLLAAAKEIRWFPSHMHVRYQHWVENLNWDWAISRQRHYGVPFPIWYSKRAGEEGAVLLPNIDQLPVDPLVDLPPGYKREEVEPEFDVMDTWATSSVTPQVAMGYDTEFAKENFPMSLRLQAHDIIRTWAFYTIVKGVYGFNTVPWKDIAISGHVLDSKGQKMSKSKGNVVDPISVMATYSTDALRFWAASGKLGEDHPWQEKDITTAKRTITKLFNAGKFTIGNLSGYDPLQASTIELELLDRWLLHKLQKTIDECTEAFETYEYSRARFAIDQFFWSVYCDNYLELVKDRIYSSATRGEQGKIAAQHTLHSAMLSILKLFAPFMPHITEEMYQAYFQEHDGARSIHNSRWPLGHEEWTQDEAGVAGDFIVQILGGIRKHRSEQKIGMKIPLQSLTICCDDKTRQLIESGIPDLQAAGGVAEIHWQRAEQLSWIVR